MSHGRKISVIGLGYVGLPVAAAFGRQSESVVAFDIDTERVRELRDGHDRTGEVSPAALRSANMHFTTDPKDLGTADFHIVTVPTPINDANRPDLSPVYAATRTLGRHLKKGSIVVFESTVYPGVTEEECAPILEQESGLTCGPDFTVGYSPERINPGDTEHRFETIKKVVSGQDAATLEVVAEVYASVVTAGVHRAPNVRTAEAAKVIENTQRDLNIALMNELSLIFHRLDIDTHDVLAAARTKWNFLPFYPGLVGGHCIGVDPYYLTHRAERAGYHPQVILAGRYINDGIGRFVARETARRIYHGGADGRPTAVVLGLTFKEDVPDIRNTRAIDIVRELEAFGVGIQVHDPAADPAEVEAEFGLRLVPMEKLTPADAVVLAVAHREYLDGGWPLVAGLLKDASGVVADVRGCLERTEKPAEVSLWRL
jgi:UDP-N-acetyl-D-galactosamine dehydrogenase